MENPFKIFIYASSYQFNEGEEGGIMLFHITHVHPAESCPYHDPEMVAKTYGKAMSGFEEAGVTLHGAYVDALAHTFYLIVESNDLTKIHAALGPIIVEGSAEIRPVLDAAAAVRARMSSD